MVVGGVQEWPKAAGRGRARPPARRGEAWRFGKVGRGWVVGFAEELMSCVRPIHGDPSVLIEIIGLFKNILKSIF